eukprot:7464914-Alexandrium_andersonii.AAC.1
MQDGKAFTYSILAEPARVSRDASDTNNAIDTKTFVAEALREPGGVRTTWALFDRQPNVPESGWQSIADPATEG